MIEPAIDSYCHCGRTKYLPVEDVVSMMQRARIDRAVLVQHLGEFDNGYLASTVRAQPDLFTAVGLVDAEDRGWREAVAALGEADEFRGVRVPRSTILERPELMRAAADAGLVLVLDASDGISECLPAIRELLAGGSAGIVVSHLGYPWLLDGTSAPEAERLLELAGEPGVHVLLSGHSMWFEPPFAELDAYTREVVDAFGPEAIVWGSNFPVSGDAARVAADLELLHAQRFGLADDGLALVTHGNAARLWFAADRSGAVR